MPTGTVLATLDANAPPRPRELSEARKALAASAKSTATSASWKKPPIHTRSEANRLVLDHGLHSWLRTRQKSADQARPRTYLTRHRRAMLEGAFASIDRDDSGEIDRHELCFALEQLGLNADLANAIMDEGDANGDGRLDLEEFMALVQKLNAREIRMELLDARERRRASKGKAAIGGDSAVVVDPIASTCAASASARHSIGGVGGGGGRGGGGSSSTAATHRSREVRAQRSGGATSEVVNSVSMLVDRAAGGFPIGLLANAQQVSALVAQYAPDSPMVRQRERRREALEAAAAADAATWGFGDAEEDSIEGHAARVPASMGDPTPSNAQASSTTVAAPALAAARATSAPGLKSTVHTRWLQRGSTAKGRQQLLAGASGPLPSVHEALPGTSRHRDGQHRAASAGTDPGHPVARPKRNASDAAAVSDARRGGARARATVSAPIRRTQTLPRI